MFVTTREKVTANPRKGMVMSVDNEPDASGCKEGGCRQYAIFWGILLLAVALRLPGLGAAPWLDEVYSLNWAEKPWVEVLRGSVQDTEHLTCFMPLVTKLAVETFRSPVVADELVARLPQQN